MATQQEPVSGNVDLNPYRSRVRSELLGFRLDLVSAEHIQHDIFLIVAVIQLGVISLNVYLPPHRKKK